MNDQKTTTINCDEINTAQQSDVDVAICSKILFYYYHQKKYNNDDSNWNKVLNELISRAANARFIKCSNWSIILNIINFRRIEPEGGRFLTDLYKIAIKTKLPHYNFTEFDLYLEANYNHYNSFL